MLFFTSDTHFGEQRALELSRRPFKTTDEMDAVMIENWNRVVAKDDTVFHLGDFGDSRNITKLNGFIHILPGNYERKMFRENPASKHQFNTLYTKLVDKCGTEYFIDDRQDNEYKMVIDSTVVEIHTGTTTINDLQWSVMLMNDFHTFILTHEPNIESPALSLTNSVINLFGHIHGRQKIKRYGMDVGVDGNNFSPVTLDDVMFYRNALMRGYYDKYVFC